MDTIPHVWYGRNKINCTLSSKYEDAKTVNNICACIFSKPILQNRLRFKTMGHDKLRFYKNQWYGHTKVSKYL